MENWTPISILRFLILSLLILNINAASYCNLPKPFKFWNCVGSTATFDAKAHQAVSKIIIQETYEPRISFIYNKTLDKHVKQDFIFHEEYIHGNTDC